MKKLIRTILFGLLMSLILIPNAFAQDNTEGTKMVRFNGIYETAIISHAHTIKRTNGKIIEEYDSDVPRLECFRFFPDGTVTTTVESDKKTSEIYQELDNIMSVKYTVSDGEIEFSFSYPNGTVEYRGTIMSGDKLELDFHSSINNATDKLKCNFIEVR